MGPPEKKPPSDASEPIEQHEATEPIENAEPIEPIEQNEATEPMLNELPMEPIEQNEPSEPCELDALCWLSTTSGSSSGVVTFVNESASSNGSSKSSDLLR
jgi:hypothetical protein